MERMTTPISEMSDPNSAVDDVSPPLSASGAPRPRTLYLFDVRQPRPELEAARRFALALADDETYLEVMSCPPNTLPPRVSFLTAEGLRPCDPRYRACLHQVSQACKNTADCIGAGDDYADPPNLDYPLISERLYRMFEENRCPIVMTSVQRAFLIKCYNYTGKQFTNEIVNTMSHVFGALLAIPAAIYLVVRTVMTPPPSGPGITIPVPQGERIASAVIYGIGLVCCLMFSALYHGIGLRAGSWKLYKFSRRMDHLMIFVLIAGSFMPVTFGIMRSYWFLISGWSMVFILFLVAIVEWSTLFRPDLVPTAFFGFFQGAMPVIGAIGLAGLTPLPVGWLIGVFYAAGGAMYLIGMIFFAIDLKTKDNSSITGHEIFHFLIILAAATHYVAVYLALFST